MNITRIESLRGEAGQRAGPPTLAGTVPRAHESLAAPMDAVRRLASAVVLTTHTQEVRRRG